MQALTSGSCRYCCKSLFALPIKNSKGYRRDIRVKMWGTSSPDDKLVSDLAKAAEATKIGARRLDRLMAGKLSPRNFGLLQQNPFISRNNSARLLGRVRAMYGRRPQCKEKESDLSQN